MKVSSPPICSNAPRGKCFCSVISFHLSANSLREEDLRVTADPQVHRG